MRSILIAFFLAVSTYTAADGLDDLQPRHWYEVPNSKLRSLDPCPKRDCSYSANEGLAGLIDDWNGGAFATGLGDAGSMIVWGGGHSGYFGNEVYAFDVAKRAWRRVTEPVADPECDHTEGELQDGSPCSAHTYDYIDYHPRTNSLVKLGSTSNHERGGGGSPRVHLFDFNTLKWRRGARRENFGDQTGASSAYDPKRDVFWFFAPYNNWFAHYDPNARSGEGQWTNHQQLYIEIDAVAAVDPVRDLYVVIDGRGKKQILAFDLSKPKSEPVVLRTEGDLTVQQTKGHGFEWDPQNRCFVAWAGGTSVYVLQPPENERQWKSKPWRWHVVPAAASNLATPGPENERGTYSRWRYVPKLDAWIVVNSIDRNVFFYKLGKLPEGCTP